MKMLLRHVLVISLFVGVITIAAVEIDRIQKIDFKNFNYAWDDPNGDVPLTWQWITGSPRSRIRTVNGIHHFYEPGQEEYERERAPLISVDSVAYGDLDADGIEEAAVALNYSTGGSANWDYLYVYKLGHGDLILLGRMETGSRAYGGLLKASIEKGLLVVEFADPDKREGDCCSKGYIRVRYRWAGKTFVEEGPRERGDVELNE